MNRAILSVMVLALLGLGISAYFLSRPQASLAKPEIITQVYPTPTCSTWDFSPVNGTLPFSGNFTFHACIGDGGRRFKFTFIGIELTGPSPGQTQTAIVYVTVPGLCSFFTADVNSDWKVDITDVWLVATEFSSARPVDSNNPVDIMGDGLVDIRDVSCVAFYYGRSQNPF